MNKQQLLKHLESDIYCRIGRSGIHGVGVIAIRDIPKGTNPFRESKDYNEIEFDRSELEHLHPEVKKMVFDFFHEEKDHKVYIPEFGLNNLDISFFQNHSENPNVKALPGGIFVTIKDIKAGEELTVDYRTYDEI